MKLRNALTRQQSDESTKDLIVEIKQIKSELDRAYDEFQNQTDNDLLEASIFKIQALRSKYSYLLKQAKLRQVRSGNDIFGAYRKAE